ncbi:MAG: hypothetical protein L0214_14385, partial [candidate division NC10 bacterium]|nr:hypothetical protein [candidate division NC10 bacterium]
VYRQNYEGAPFVMTFDIIASNEGTPWSRSLVPVRSDVYFVGRAGLYVVRGGLQVIPLGAGQVWRKLFDFKYQNESISTLRGTVVEEESTVVGTYDPQSNLIVWLLRPKGELFFTGVRLLWYSIDEDRFGWANVTIPGGQTLVQLVGTPNVQDASPHFLRGLSALTFVSAGKPRMRLFESPRTEAVTLKTEILSSEAVAQFDLQSRDIQINAVRPIFLSSGAGSFEDFITGTVEAGEDPQLSDVRMSTSFTSADQDDDGWFPVGPPTMGGYHRFTWNFPTLYNLTLLSLTGFEVRWEVRGKR